jgi:hypothetical protein
MHGILLTPDVNFGENAERSQPFLPSDFPRSKRPAASSVSIPAGARMETPVAKSRKTFESVG